MSFGGPYRLRSPVSSWADFSVFYTIQFDRQQAHKQFPPSVSQLIDILSIEFVNSIPSPWKPPGAVANDSGVVMVTPLDSHVMRVCEVHSKTNHGELS